MEVNVFLFLICSKTLSLRVIYFLFDHWQEEYHLSHILTAFLHTKRWFSLTLLALVLITYKIYS